MELTCNVLGVDILEGGKSADAYNADAGNNVSFCTLLGLVFSCNKCQGMRLTVHQGGKQG